MIEKISVLRQLYLSLTIFSIAVIVLKYFNHDFEVVEDFQVFDSEWVGRTGTSQNEGFHIKPMDIYFHEFPLSVIIDSIKTNHDAIDWFTEMANLDSSKQEDIELLEIFDKSEEFMPKLAFYSDNFIPQKLKLARKILYSKELERFYNEEMPKFERLIAKHDLHGLKYDEIISSYEKQLSTDVSISGLDISRRNFNRYASIGILGLMIFFFTHLRVLEIEESNIGKIAFMPLYSDFLSRSLTILFLGVFPMIASFPYRSSFGLGYAVFALTLLLEVFLFIKLLKLQRQVVRS